MKVLMFLTSFMFCVSSNALTVEIPVPAEMTCEVKPLYGDNNSDSIANYLITYSRTNSIGPSLAHYFTVENKTEGGVDEMTFGYRSRSVFYFQDDSFSPEYFNELCGNYSSSSELIFYTAGGDRGPSNCLVCHTLATQD